MKTYADLLTEVPAHLVAEAEVPVLSGLQRQGDLLVVPTTTTRIGLGIPPEGVDVIEARDGGHAHTLVGDVLWAPETRQGTELGTVTIPDGGQGFLLHAEHGATGIAPGSYILRRQREQSDVQRVVAD